MEKNPKYYTYFSIEFGKIILNFEVILHFPTIQMFLFLFEFPTLPKFLKKRQFQNNSS